jgi:GLPGLI family protein
MKKLITGATLFLLAMITLLPVANAQKAPFIGTVVYSVSLVGDIPDQAKAMMPTEMIMKVSPDKLIQVLHSDMVDIKTIFDAPKQISYHLMDMMGQKFCIKNTAAQLDEQRKKTGMVMSVKSTNDTKIIAGHNCRRAIVTVKTNQSAAKTFDTYYTEDIDISKFSFGNIFPKVNGLPLEFSMNQGPYILKMTAKSIKKENIPASAFAIPADYKQVTGDQLKTMVGGGGQ